MGLHELLDREELNFVELNCPKCAGCTRPRCNRINSDSFLSRNEQKAKKPFLKPEQEHTSSFYFKHLFFIQNMKGDATTMDEEEKGLTCDECQRPIQYGGDLLTVEKGVSGPRGVITLDDTLTFCQEECLSKYFNGASVNGLPQVPPRIP